jgi:hypothetical protein
MPSMSRPATSSSTTCPAPLHIDDHGLAERLARLTELDEDDRTSLLRDLDTMLTRSRRHALANDDAKRNGQRAVREIGVQSVPEELLDVVVTDQRRQSTRRLRVQVDQVGVRAVLAH